MSRFTTIADLAAVADTFDAEFGADSVDRGVDPDRFVSENEILAAEIAEMEEDLYRAEVFEAERYEAWGH